MTTPRLITITFSHYCEKARWTLDRAGIAYNESGHLPPFHAFAARRNGGQRAVPILVTDQGVIDDSTRIAQWADRERPEAHLYGKNDEERREIEALEERFDEELGPHTRRWLYFHLLPDRDRTLGLFGAQEGPLEFEKLALPPLFPLLRFVMRKAMRITPSGAERSLRKVVEVFAEVDRRLADGRRYLVGDRLTMADITFACLGGVLLSPPEYRAKLPEAESLPPDVTGCVRAFRDQPAGAFALRIFRDHRRGSFSVNSALGG